MPTAVQMPLNVGQPKKLGRGLWRKQILPVGKTLDVNGQKLDLTPGLLGKIKQTFDSGFLASTPFQLVDDANAHTDDPERTRGTVRALDLTADGLYATLDLPDGLLEHNPNLGVSPRLLFGETRADGRKAEVLLRHVAATNDPHVGGMHPFERIADLSADTTPVVDLTAATYQGDRTMAELPADALAALSALATRLNPDGTFKDAEPADDDAQVDQAEVERILAELEDGDDEQPETDELEQDEPELVGASLSAAGGSVDLAASLEQTRNELAAVQKQLHREKWEARADQLRQGGVPPYMVELAAKVLATPAKQIDLAAGDTDPYAVINEMLTKCPRLDLAAERGSAGGAEPSQSAEDDRFVEAWNAQL